MKRRAATLTMLSIASFIALAYWGVSSATKPGFQTEISSATRSPEPAHAAQTVTTPDPQHAAAAATPATAKSSGLVADRPTPAPIAADQTQAPSAAPEPSATATAAQLAPEAAATAEPTPTASAAEPSTTLAPEKIAAAKPTPVVPPSAAQPAPKPATPAPAAPPLAAAIVKKPEPTPQPTNDARQAPFRVRNPLLVVRALPEGVVRLWLDGQRMANPFDVRLPRDSKHKIEARAEGYETSSQTVRIEADAKLTFALRRVAPPALAHAAASSAAPARGAANTALESSAKTADKRHHGAGFVTTNPY
jgi:hypothetical protein